VAAPVTAPPVAAVVYGCGERLIRWPLLAGAHADATASCGGTEPTFVMRRRSHHRVAAPTTAPTDLPDGGVSPT